MKIECPSGLTLDARAWNLGDQNQLMDTKQNEAGLLPLRMLEVATQGCVHPGPYPFKEGGPVNFHKVSIADIVTANYLIRKKTRPQYDFRVPCQYCGKLTARTIDMNEVEVFEASGEGIEHLRTGVPIIIKIPEEDPMAILELKILRGASLPELARYQDKTPEQMLELQACMSVDKIIPQEASAELLLSLGTIREYWRAQSWDFGDEVRVSIDVAEGGVDSTFEFRCENQGCRKEQLGTVPLDTEFYGLDPVAARERRRKRLSERRSRERPTSPQ